MAKNGKIHAAKVVVLGPKCATQGIKAVVLGPKCARDPWGTILGPKTARSLGL